MEKRMSLVVAVLASLVFAGAARAVEVKLQVVETDQVARKPAAITTGVPFARGAVKEVSRLAVRVGGQSVPAQFIQTAPWNDGSVRWALMDVQTDVPASGPVELVVSDVGGNPAPAAPLKVQETPDAIAVSTGPLEFRVSAKKPGLFESFKVDGAERLTELGRGVVLYKAGGGDVIGQPAEVAVEQAGPLRAVVRVRGRFPGVHNDLLTYTARLTAFAGRKFVKVHLWLENQGAMGYFTTRNDAATSTTAAWFAFDGLAVELGLGLGGSPVARCEGVSSDAGLKVLQYCTQTHGQEKVQYKKAPFYTYDDLNYTITAGGKELKRGARTDGVVELIGRSAPLTAAVRDFWENYEKAIEVDRALLRLWLWPTEGVWPRPRPNLHGNELYDKTLQALAQDGVYLIPGAVHKGHEFILDFSGRPAAETLAELRAPLVALAPAAYYATTEAAPGLFAPPEVRTGLKDCDAKLDAWLRMTRSAADPAAPTGIWAARLVPCESQVGYMSDSSYWFGWMDFGDLFIPGRGPVSLSYDWTYLMLLGALRTGDPNFVRLGSQMARHRIDIDQLWSDKDPPEINGLQRGDFNFPSFHCYRLYAPPRVGTNWLAGVVLHYLLTGEAKALECARRNADGLKTAWAWIDRTKPYAGPQGDMADNAWGIESYCAMHALTADKTWLDEALGLFNRHVVPKWKTYGPFLHDPDHQIQSQDYIQEDLKYCYSIASFCQLHHLTRDETVFKLLQEGTEKPFPDSFFEAPLYLSDLYAYVGMVTKKPALLKQAAESLSQAFPESKCPPVFLPGNTTWGRTSAMMLRTGHILQYANWKK
jgi:hypothetical protein